MKGFEVFGEHFDRIDDISFTFGIVQCLIYLIGIGICLYINDVHSITMGHDDFIHIFLQITKKWEFIYYFPMRLHNYEINISLINFS